MKVLSLRKILFLVSFLSSIAASAATIPRASYDMPVFSEKLSNQLSSVQNQVLKTEKALIQSLKNQDTSRSRIHNLRKLMSLQAEELKLGRQRFKELSSFVKELESRRHFLREKIFKERKQIRRFLREIHTSVDRASIEGKSLLSLPRNEKLEAPRRKVLSKMIDHSFAEIEALKADMEDANSLEEKLQEQKLALQNFVTDLRERQSMMKFNKILEIDILKKKYSEKLKALENYKKLKATEAQIRGLITQFNARAELEKIVETRRDAYKDVMTGRIIQKKGALPFPIRGKVVSHFGKAFDPKSKLQIFRKGIEIVPEGSEDQVRSIYPGRVVFSGTLPGYERTTIVSHGGHHYSLVAHLESAHKRKGDWVGSGDIIGAAKKNGEPVYFEIRSRNVAVNPLQWLQN